MNPYSDHRAAKGTLTGGSCLVLSRSLSISLSAQHSLASLWLTAQKFVQRFPLGSGILGFPYRTNKLALLSALTGTVLSLSGLTVVDLGLIPLKLLWSDPSPSVDAKEVPRLNDFWLYRLLQGSRHPP